MTYVPPSPTSYNAASVAITGGTINGTTVGATTASSGKFSSLIMGATTVTSFGTGIGNLALFTDPTSAGFPRFRFNSRFIIDNASPAATDFATLQVIRNTTFSGGTTANINHNFISQGVYGSGDATFNSALTASATTSGTSGGKIIGGWLQAFRNAGSTDTAWGSVVSIVDSTQQASGTNNARTLTAEYDFQASLADNATNGANFGGVGLRKFIHFAALRDSGTDPMEMAHGLWFSTTESDGTSNTTACVIDSIIGFSSGCQIIQGLDTRGAVAPSSYINPLAAVRCSAGQIGIDFNGGAALNSAPGNYLQYSSSNAALSYFSGTSEVVRFEDKTNTSYFDFSYISGGNIMQLGIGGAYANLRFQANGGGAVQINSPLSLLSATNQKVVVFTTTGNYTATATDNIIIVKKATGAATTVTLPSSPTTGRHITVKDGKGDANTNNITITPASGTIDGSANIVLNANYSSVDLIYNGTEWNVV